MQLFVSRSNADAAAASVAGPLIRVYPAEMQFFCGYLGTKFCGFCEILKNPEKYHKFRCFGLAEIGVSTCETSDAH